MKDFTSEIKNSLDALFKIENNASGKKKKLFEKDKNVCLKVAIFRIPKMRGVRKKYLKLRHSRFGDDPDVCLFVPNRRSEVEYKLSTDDSINITVDYYQDFLAKHKVKGIKTIMPLKQLQSEYAAYELKRKLVDRFDLFLCKTSLLYNHRFLKCIGKYFIKKNKEPLGISLPAWNAPYDENFNKRIERAILLSTMKIKPFSDNYSIPIGLLSQSKENLQENLKVVLDQIINEDIVPGGFSNVQGLYLATSSSGSIPLYISTDFPENVPWPKVVSRIKKIKPVEDEITTLPGKKVLVKPSGEVIVKKVKQAKKNEKLKGELVVEEEESEDDLEDIEDGSEEEENERLVGFEASDTDDDNHNSSSVKANEPNDSESEEESDDEIERRENRLMIQSKIMKGEDEEESEENEDSEEDTKPPPQKIRKTEKVKKKKKIMAKNGKNKKKIKA